MLTKQVFQAHIVSVSIFWTAAFLGLSTVFSAFAQTPPVFLFLMTTVRPDITSGSSIEATSQSPSSLSQGTTQSISKRNSVEPIEGLSPIHKSVKAGDIGKTRSLLSTGANVNQKTASGKTPLHLAVLARDASMTELLLKNGADVTVKDAAGHAPIDYWDSEAGVEILMLLKSYEDKPGLSPVSQGSRGAVR